MINKYNSSRTRQVISWKTLFKFFLMLLTWQNVSAQVTIPAANTNTASNRKPFGSFYGFERTAAIYTAAEHGMSSGSTVTSICFYVNAVTTPDDVPVNIYMATTTAATFTASTFASQIAGATSVYSGTITGASLVAGSWRCITLTTPFAYTGDNLKVMVEANYGGGGNEVSTAKQFRWSAGASQTWQTDTTAPTGNGAVSATSRPNVQLSFTPPVGPGTLQFSSATYAGNEGSTATVTVNRLGGQTGIVSVDYATSNGSANSGLDYTTATGTLTWADNDFAPKTFTIPLSTDLIADPAETVNLTLSNPTGTTITGTNPTVLTITDVPPPLNGTYTVGTAGNYSSLTNVGGIFDALNLSGASGNITINIISDLTGETGVFALNEIAGGFTTLIKPVGAPRLITGSSTVSIIKINAADGVTIDGTLASGTSRDLTVENTSTGAVIWIASTAVNGALNNTVKNTNVLGNTLQTAQGIIVGGSVFGSAAEVSNSNLTITNNTFKKVQNGVFAIGNATTPDQNWVVSNNVAGSTVVAEKLTFRGLAVQNAQNFTISGNEIFGVVTATTTTMTGILVGSNAFNGNVFSNKISDIKNTNTGGYGSNGIFLNSSNVTANINVFNNFIFDVSGYGWTAALVGDNGYGIFVNSGAGYNIDHNTINMNANQTLATSVPAAINVGVGVTVAGAINLRNNIFVCSLTVPTQRYVIYSAAPNTVFGTINNNDYFTTGANLGFIGSARATLADIVTGFGQNAASVSIAPVFVSATDLHLNSIGNSTLDNLGTPIATVTTDIDSEARNATAPDMGADEGNFLSVNQFEVTNGFKAYPNPVSQMLTIEFTSDLTQVSIFNLVGQEVLSRKVNTTSTQIDLSSLNVGTYLVKVEAGSVSKTLKVFKK
jgi:hypothetical protein